MSKLLTIVRAAACSLALCACMLAAQQDTQKTVSGPDQWNKGKSTGKSYKKGTQATTQVDGSKTGQSHRHGNTGDLTRNGNDVNGKRGEESGANSKKGKAEREKTPDSK